MIESFGHLTFTCKFWSIHCFLWLITIHNSVLIQNELDAKEKALHQLNDRFTITKEQMNHLQEEYAALAEKNKKENQEKDEVRTEEYERGEKERNVVALANSRSILNKV